VLEIPEVRSQFKLRGIDGLHDHGQQTPCTPPGDEEPEAFA
jgi:hypothetical protein